MPLLMIAHLMIRMRQQRQLNIMELYNGVMKMTVKKC